MSSRPRRWPFRLAVTVVVVLAVSVAAALTWQFWLVGRLAADRASAASNGYAASCRLDPGFDGAPADAADGAVIGTLTLPGSSTAWPIRVGVGDDSLRDSVGWYSGTSGPGGVGNMAVVGQRLTAGGAFDTIMSLNVGDQIVVETCRAKFTYTVQVAPRDLTVQPADTWVLDPVPGQPGAMPADAWLTLIANQDVLPTSDRAVGFAKLTATTAK